MVHYFSVLPLASAALGLCVPALLDVSVQIITKLGKVYLTVKF